MLDNHLFRPNSTGLDHRRITWGRALDMNDRALRSVIVGLGGPFGGIPREDGFMITAASEVMAIFCLAKDLPDLKERLGNIIIGYTRSREPVRCRDIGADTAMTILMRDALHPNLVQTLGGTPAFIHGGPFANIAHGCNSLIATRAGLKLGDIVVTEAGFGADLGAEKFFDIKCRLGGLSPDAVAIVSTIRALKMNGGASKDSLANEDLDALRAGMENLYGHVENVAKFGVPAVVALNRFASDTDRPRWPWFWTDARPAGSTPSRPTPTAGAARGAWSSPTPCGRSRTAARPTSGPSTRTTCRSRRRSRRWRRRSTAPPGWTSSAG